MSEEVLLVVGDRLVRARPITVYEPIPESIPEVPAEVPAPPQAVEVPKRDTSRNGVRYSAALKANILAEANQPGVFAKDVARKYNINPSSISHWRKMLHPKGKRRATWAS